MAQARLLQAVCTVAMLAAVPAFAQNTAMPPANQTGGNGMPPAGDNLGGPAYHSGHMAQNNANSSMAPAGNPGSENQGSEGQESENRGSMHHSGMMEHSRHAMRAGRNDTSQDAAVDELNERSYRAAQKGETFNAANSGGGAGMSNESPGSGMSGHGMSGGSSGGMNDMSGGSMSHGSSGSMPAGGGASGSGGKM